MKITEFKLALSDFMKGMLDNWFPDKPFIKGLGISLVEANVSKMDNLLEMFANADGDIDVNGLIKNFSDINEPLRVDLTTISPLLPKRVLLITKEDFNDFLKYADQREKREVQRDIQRTHSEGISGHTPYGNR